MAAGEKSAFIKEQLSQDNKLTYKELNKRWVESHPGSSLSESSVSSIKRWRFLQDFQAPVAESKPSPPKKKVAAKTKTLGKTTKKTALKGGKKRGNSALAPRLTSPSVSTSLNGADERTTHRFPSAARREAREAVLSQAETKLDEIIMVLLPFESDLDQVISNLREARREIIRAGM